MGEAHETHLRTEGLAPGSRLMRFAETALLFYVYLACQRSRLVEALRSALHLKPTGMRRMPKEA